MVVDSFLIVLVICMVHVALPAGNLSVSLVLLVLAPLADPTPSKPNSHSFDSNLFLA
jgi:hypothetical protein